MRSNRSDSEREERMAIAFGVLGVLAVVLYGYPQLLGSIVGGFVGAALVWRTPAGADERRRWRGLAAWTLAAAVAVAAAYFLLADQLGADRELRRFGRQWGLGDITWSVLLDHPWGWVPLFAAAGLAACGLAVLWRVR